MTPVFDVRRMLPVLALLILAGCGGGAPLPATPPVVKVKMVDDRFLYEGRIPAGRVVFDTTNEGSKVHRLALLPLEDSVPPIVEQLQGDERLITRPYAGTPPRAPGDRGTFAVDLAAGQRYAIICFVRDPSGKTHGAQGMASEFRAGQ